jgi:hypothetical protein
VYGIENVVAHALKTHHYQEIKSKVSKIHSTNLKKLKIIETKQMGRPNISSSTTKVTY